MGGGAMLGALAPSQAFMNFAGLTGQFIVRYACVEGPPKKN
jgi:hypothetical protein